MDVQLNIIVVTVLLIKYLYTLVLFTSVYVCKKISIMFRNIFHIKRAFILVSLNVFIFCSSFSQEVVLNVFDKTKGEAQLRFYQESKINNYEFSRSMALGDKKKFTDSTYQVTLKLNYLYNIITCSWLYDNKYILLTQGDSLDVLVDYSKKDRKLYKVIFKGGNENHYNTNTSRQLSEITRSILSRIEYTKNIQEIIQVLDSVNMSNNNILKKISPSLYKEIRINEENANYFYYLYLALMDRPEVVKHSDILKLKDKFFSKKIECQYPILMESRDYKGGMYCLSELLCRNIQGENRLMAVTDTINKYFSGELRDFILSTNFYGTYISNQKEFRMDADVHNWIKKYSGKMRQQVYNDYISYTYNKYKKIDTHFPAEILAEKFISLNDSSVISLGEILNKNRGNPIIVDHWAIWCSACIREIIDGKKNTGILEKKGLQFIYLSLDGMQDYNKAKKKATDLGIDSKAYILPGNFETKYVKYLNISSIPIYIFINAEGIIKNIDFARPRDISDFDELFKQ